MGHLDVDSGYLWNLYLGRIKKEVKTCGRCGAAIVHSSDWWVDAQTYDARCGHGPAWTGHYPVPET